jgi:hypothetical protein
MSGLFIAFEFHLLEISLFKSSTVTAASKIPDPTWNVVSGTGRTMTILRQGFVARK